MPRAFRTPEKNCSGPPAQAALEAEAQIPKPQGPLVGGRFFSPNHLKVLIRQTYRVKRRLSH